MPCGRGHGFPGGGRFGGPMNGPPHTRSYPVMEAGPNSMNEPRFRGPPGPIGFFVRRMIKKKEEKRQMKEESPMNSYQKMGEWNRDIPSEWRDEKGDRDFELRERERVERVEVEKKKVEGERKERRETMLPSYREAVGGK